MKEYELRGEPYSQKSRWINHSNERIFQVMTFNKYSGITVADLKGVQGVPRY